MITSSKILSPIYSEPERFDSGWVVCNDWTNQNLGNTVGANLVHNLGRNLQDLTVRIIFSPTGADTDSVYMYDVQTDGNPGGNNPTGQNSKCK